MHFSYAIFFALAAVVSTQTIESEEAMLPSCALTCLNNAISSAGCSTTDYTCQCQTHLNDITASASPCVLKACSVTEATSVEGITAEICKLGLAQASSSGSSSVTSAASSSAASASSSVSSKVSSVASSATSAASASAGSASTTASSAATSSTGGAGQVRAGLGVIGAAVVAAMAL